ncbi:MULTISPECIES: cytidine deaminase [Vagococcus]|uniref:Cytidine deaminase n=1 Tax=Vagococcus fluvialis bH819 TaxID=1255619 RepID=A0A1X6WMU0_9ENTE|nr:MULTISPECIES: cytidine deaminase [Vagococcus]SLM85643.1 Cytidine deaminase [Vagococcus fluvialis bH819]HCM89609.1 cytidine deaminase [Vagococcus sp.]
MFEKLKIEASKVINPREYSKFAEGGQVAAALETISGNIYTGICIDTACSMGFCAEHAAAADMLKHGETQVVRMVAIDREGKYLSPCGRCREFLSQLDDKNTDMEILLADGEVYTLKELLPFDWKN